jgi:acyl carrier protein
VDDALAVPVKIDFTVLNRLARTTEIPAVLRGLVRTAGRRNATSREARERSLVERLAALPAAERQDAVLEAVLEQVADVLGHSSGALIDAERAFTELGFDSLSSVNLRNKLNTMFGLRLAATVVFDHPSPRAVAVFVLSLLPGLAEPVAAVDDPVADEEPLEAGLIDEMDADELVKRVMAATEDEFVSLTPGSENF